MAGSCRCDEEAKGMRFNTTKYYDNEVKIKHPGIRDEWVERVLANPIRTREQPKGRKAYWGYISEAEKVLRVITLGDGTVHNRFWDRDFTRRWKQNPRGYRS